MRNGILAALALVACGLVGGCGSDDADDEPPAVVPTIGTLDDRYFRSISVSGAEPAPDRPLTLSFGRGTMKTEAKGKMTDMLGRSDTKGSLSSSGGCNSASGNFTINDGVLKKDEMGAWTMMRCRPGLLATDRWFDKFLRRGAEVRVSGSELTLTNERGERVAMTDSHDPVVGTGWEMASMVRGGLGHSLMPGIEKVRFLFAEDGTVQFTTGCNTGFAEYEISGDSIRFGSVTVGEKACRAGVTRLERKILETLEDEPSIDFDGQTFNLVGQRYGLELKPSALVERA